MFLRVYVGVRTCEVFLCFVTIMFVLSIVLTSLFSLFYVTRERNRILHRAVSNVLSALRIAHVTVLTDWLACRSCIV